MRTLRLLLLSLFLLSLVLEHDLVSSNRLRCAFGAAIR